MSNYTEKFCFGASWGQTSDWERGPSYPSPLEPALPLTHFDF